MKIKVIIGGEENDFFLKTLAFKRAQETMKNTTSRTSIRSSDRYKIEVEVGSNVTTHATMA